MCLDTKSNKSEILRLESEKLVNASLARSTWTKYNSGLNAYLDYCNYADIENSWPMTIEEIRSFAVYCISIRNVTPETAKGYVANLRLAHKLQGLESPCTEKDKILNMIFAGAKI